MDRLGFCAKGTAPSGRMGRGSIRYPALKCRATQIFAPSGRALERLPGCLLTTRTKRQPAV
jgi:hypothetical protein